MRASGFNMRGLEKPLNYFCTLFPPSQKVSSLLFIQLTKESSVSYCFRDIPVICDVTKGVATPPQIFPTDLCCEALNLCALFDFKFLHCGIYEGHLHLLLRLLLLHLEDPS